MYLRHFDIEENLTVTVGWDQLRGTFFAKVEGMVQDDEREAELELFRGLGLGSEGDESFTLDQIVFQLASVNIVAPQKIIDALANDKLDG